VDFEINYEPTSITLSEACGLVWQCTDTMPGWVFGLLEELGPKSHTYAAAARALRRWLAAR
jgi:hypothetical protein